MNASLSEKSSLQLIFMMTYLYCSSSLAADAPGHESKPTAHATGHHQAAPMAAGYTTIKGDTLDKIIGKTMTSSPIKIGVIRQAFVHDNPTAFISNNPNRMLAGANLKIPNLAPILQSELDKLNINHKNSSHRESKPTSKEERRHWVRYP